MTDHQKLLIALFGENDRRDGGEVSVFDVMSMLYELGEEHRSVIHHQLARATAQSATGGRASRCERSTTGSSVGNCRAVHLVGI
jgi:hypothetical protein